MHTRLLVPAAALVAILTAGGAAAQSPTAVSDPAARPDAARSPLTYDSAFAGYRAWREPERRDWREANAEAGALGGHVGQLRGRPSLPAADRRGQKEPVGDGTTPAAGTPGGQRK